MTVKVAALMIGVAWTAPTLISFLPIFLGWYTTEEHQKWRKNHPNECILRVRLTLCPISVPPPTNYNIRLGKKHILKVH